METSTKPNWKTDWSKCCLCQQEKNEDLRSPVTNPTKREIYGYTNIAINIPLFVAINALPIVLDPARLDGGGGIEETLRKKQCKISTITPATPQQYKATKGTKKSCYDSHSFRRQEKT